MNKLESRTSGNGRMVHKGKEFGKPVDYGDSRADDIIVTLYVYPTTDKPGSFSRIGKVDTCSFKTILSHSNLNFYDESDIL